MQQRYQQDIYNATNRSRVIGANLQGNWGAQTVSVTADRSETLNNDVSSYVYGSKPEWLDDAFIAERAARSYDRCFCPAGIARQMTAVGMDGSRSDALGNVDVPALVMHGSRDTLIDPSGGRHTAEVIPGARYVEIEGMGHDYPVAVWPQWVAIWAGFARSAVSGARKDLGQVPT